ncbi:MAG: YbjN domain-containing protein [Chloroflexi bacterium]|nr:YbjN domain-containing protein [Chloroflexota bacterium]
MTSRSGEQDQMKAMLATVREILESSDVDPQPIEGDAGYSFLVSIVKGGPVLTGLAYVLPEEKRFVFYLEAPDRTTEKLRPRVAEFITRVNYGLSIGNYEMDYSNGGVRFKSSFDFTGGALTRHLVRNAIVCAMDSAEVYHDALRRVMAGEAEPRAAVADAEKGLALA